MSAIFHILSIILYAAILILSPCVAEAEVPDEYKDFIQSRGPDDPEYYDYFQDEDPYSDNASDLSDSDTEPAPETEPETEAPPETEPETQPETEPETQEPTFESQDSKPTDPVEEPTEPQVTEETQDPDTTDPLLQVLQSVQNTESACQYIAGFCLFFVVCLLCYFSYRFFRIFI